MQRQYGRSLRTIALSCARDAIWVCYASALMPSTDGFSATQRIQTGSVRVWETVSTHVRCQNVLRAQETDSVVACYPAVCDWQLSRDLRHHRHGALTTRLGRFSRIILVLVLQLVVGVDHLQIRIVTSCQRSRPSIPRIRDGGAPPLTSMQGSVRAPNAIRDNENVLSLGAVLLLQLSKSYRARRNHGGHCLVVRTIYQ
jgi:hypothetical protein